MDWLPPSLDHALHGLGWLAIHLLWQGALVALLLVLLTRFLDRATATARHGTALLALLALLFLPLATHFIGRSPVFSPAFDGPELSPIERMIKTVPAISSASDPATTEPDSAPLIAAGDTAETESTGPPLPVLLALFWMIGAAIAGARFAVSRLLLKRLIRDGTPLADGPWLDGQEEFRRKHGLGRTVEVRESARVSSPLLCGLQRPILLVPASGPGNLSTDEQRMILAHELGHVFHRDAWFNFLAIIAETLLFFHPAAYYVTRRLRCAAEERCDEFVLHTTGDAHAYARTLSRMDRARPRGASFILAGSGSNLLGRIRRLLEPRPSAVPSPWRMVAVLACFGALLLGCARTARLPGSDDLATCPLPEYQAEIRKALDAGDDLRALDLAFERTTWPFFSRVQSSQEAEERRWNERESMLLCIELGEAAKRRYDAVFAPPANVEDLLPIPWRHIGRGMTYYGSMSTKNLDDGSRLTLCYADHYDWNDITDDSLRALPAVTRVHEWPDSIHIVIDFERDGRAEFSYDGRAFAFGEGIPHAIDRGPEGRRGQAMLANPGEDPREATRLLFFRDGELCWLLADTDGDGMGDLGHARQTRWIPREGGTR